jgi:hypothetical protein
MIKQTWNINDDEKNRILNLHENATKLQYLTLEQSGQQSGPGVTTTVKTSNTEFPKQQLGNQFKFGEYQSDSVKKSIETLKPKIEEFIKNSGGKQFTVNISAGESNVTNPKGFETKGSLALARANSVKQYFQEILPELIKNGTLVIQGPTDVSQVIIGKTPYDKTKGDNKNPELIKQYRQEQFVNFDIKGSGQVENIESICDWTASITGSTGNPAENYVTTNIKLKGDGDLTFNTGSIPDRMIVVDGKGKIIKDTGYVATKQHQYSSFKYVPLYVSRLTQLNRTVSVSGSEIVTIKANDFNNLMKQILMPGVKMPEESQLRKIGESEIFNGIEELKVLFNKGIREFVIYTISASESISIPFDNKTGDSKVMVYSPVGKTGYSLTGKC